MSFKDMPVDDFAEASNATINIVVVLDYFITGVHWHIKY